MAARRLSINSRVTHRTSRRISAQATVQQLVQALVDTPVNMVLTLIINNQAVLLISLVSTQPTNLMVVSPINMATTTVKQVPQVSQVMDVSVRLNNTQSLASLL